MSGLACGDKLKPASVWSPLSILLGWEKTIWQNLELIVSIQRNDERPRLRSRLKYTAIA
jgi:hypothetical protein